MNEIVMKNFLLKNWYRLMLASSAMMASFGFMIYSINTVFAGNVGGNSMQKLSMPTTVTVKLTEDQLNRIVPKNEDGSINVRISTGQTLDVNLKKVGGLNTFVEKSRDGGVLGAYIFNK